MSCCLSETSDPLEVIQHVFCNKSLYGSVMQCIKLARNSREIGGVYCFNFRNPCNKSLITLSGRRILNIHEKECQISWCNNTEMIAGLTILYIDFFGQVLSSYKEALQAKNEVKEYCKSFTIPLCLFPNIPVSNKNITLSGHKIIEIMNLSLCNYCC
jgi:hypothetical protein